MSIREDLIAAHDEILKVLDDEGDASGGHLRYLLAEVERQVDLHFPNLVPDVAEKVEEVAPVAEEAATDVEHVAEDVPVPGAAEVEEVAHDVDAVATEAQSVAEEAVPAETSEPADDGFLAHLKEEVEEHFEHGNA